MMSKKKSENVENAENTAISEPDNGISETDNTENKPIVDLGADVSPVLEQVANDMSEPSGGVVLDDVNARLDDMEKVVAPDTDKSGAVFDPAIHAVNNEGEPVKTRSGNYRRKRKTSSQEISTSRKAAEYSALAFFQLGMVIFGDEWLPEEKTNEKELIVGAFDDYYIEVEVKDVPPWLGLVIALTGYSTKRFTKPKTKTKLSDIKNWLFKKIKNLRDKVKIPKTTYSQKISATDEISES